MKNIIALHHRILPRENFEKAATDIFNLLKSTQINSPNTNRVLYVDIDGHKNDQGGYDNDMLELQKEFGIDFLGKYFVEIHFPLIKFINPNPQSNDIPDKLEIFSAKNEIDVNLNNLYIENYSNTEFVSEPDIYDYLKRVRCFLTEFKNCDMPFPICDDNTSTPTTLLRLWKNHVNELINELYNSFIYGNLLTVSAMTRTLIECFVYLSILKIPENDFLIHHWFICSLCNKFDNDCNNVKNTIKNYCNKNNLDFINMWNIYSDNPKPNRWLKQIITNNPTFKSACNYLKDETLYADYENACSFVHGQDVTSKIMPFTFYVSICRRFNMMMHYIFRTIRLFPLNKSIKSQLTSLEDELFLLLEKYSN